ncbi:hypothetical protein DL96DRAFT_1620900 [Flagelloscypha sp. PMI_526]|nr:hypothetical protein DL96DRAFT_1620900 [Flagelloscypha sp. PMI_526]
MSMCSGFAALIASKPSTFFAHRTRALEQCSLLWAEIIPKLPSLRTAFWAIGGMKNLKSLTLGRLLINFLIDLIRQNDAPVFRRLTHLKLLTSLGVEENTNTLLESESFPEVSHLMILTDQALANRLVGSFVKLKVFILAIFGNPTNEDSWLKALLTQSSNVFVVFWDRGELPLATRPGKLEAFKGEANGEYTSLWNRAELETAMRV